MTTKVLIVNFGPDPVLVRTVAYGQSAQDAGAPPQVLSDTLIAVQGYHEFWVHTDQQLLVGEQRADQPARSLYTPCDQIGGAHKWNPLPPGECIYCGAANKV